MSRADAARRLRYRLAGVLDDDGAPSRREWLRVVFFALANVILLAGVAVVRDLPSPMAPRIHVRWSTGLSDAARGELERKFSLVAGERREASTWAYDLADPSPATVGALLSDPAVEDTHYIDRRAKVVSADAPRGSTWLVRSGPAAWRDSRLTEWLGLFAMCSLLVSASWLIAHRHALRAAA